MVKLRSAAYCNLKLFLIYLVVYGHLLEPLLSTSRAAFLQYQWIYAFHMPLFAFLTGLFLTKTRDCRRQLCRTLPLYLFLQTLILLTTDHGRWDIPYWHLWYLLSCSFWAAAAWLWFRTGRRWGCVILVAAVVAGCLAGFLPLLGRSFSLSRTVVFFPYFWAGVLCRNDFPFQKYGAAGAAALVSGTVLVLLHSRQLQPSVLYHAAPYGEASQAGLRLLCYIAGGLLCFGALTLTPSRRFPCTRMGADTMPAYLLHAPFVLALQPVSLFWGIRAAIGAAFLFVLYLLGQWSGKLYGIVPSERRGRTCPHSRKSTKNMPGPCTGSSLP